MGMSPDATIAWGIAFTEDPDECGEADEKLEALLEEDWDLETLFGFTEPRPWMGDPHWEGRGLDERRAIIDAYDARQNAAVPVEVDHYGSYDYGGKLLVIKRTKTRVNWSWQKVDLATLTTPPTPEEIAALHKVCDAISNPREEPALLLFAMYG